MISVPFHHRKGSMDKISDQPRQLEMTAQACQAISAPQQKPHHPLALPEIIGAIMENLAEEESRRDLFSVILVNRAWAEEGINVLWEKASIPALASVEPHRRQYYANKIRQVYIWDKDAKYHVQSQGYAFPKLKTIDVDFVHRECSIVQYLVSSLEEFTFCTRQDKKLDEYLDQLAQSCPSLRKIKLDYGPTWLHPDRLLHLLNQVKQIRCVNLKQLRCINWKPNETFFVTEDLLSHVAARHQLEEYRLPNRITADIAQRVFEKLQPHEAFSHLRMLGCSIESKAISMLTPALRSLAHLDVQVVDARGNLLQYLSTLTELKILEVKFDVRESLCAHELFALEALHQLQALILCPHHGMDLDHSVGEKDLIRFFSSFPQMETLNIPLSMTHTFPFAALVALGRTSPLLSTCHLRGKLDIEPLEAETGPLFPRLGRFVVGELVDPEPWQSISLEEKAQGLAEILLRHCPKMSAFTYYWMIAEDSLTRRVTRTVNELAQERKLTA